MSRSITSSASAIVDQLKKAPRMNEIHPIAGRFIYSLRLIGLHVRQGRDPLPELAVRIGSFETASAALALTQVIGRAWPENINITNFCCPMLTHDEATIGNCVAATANQDRPAFDAALKGLVRPDRMERLWDATLAYVAAELRPV